MSLRTRVYWCWASPRDIGEFPASREGPARARNARGHLATGPRTVAGGAANTSVQCRASGKMWKDVERCGKMWKGLLDHGLGICPKDVKYSHTAYNPRRLIESVESKAFSMGNCVCMQVSCLLLSGCLHIFPFYKWACRVPGAEGSRRLWYHSHHFIARQCVQRHQCIQRQRAEVECIPTEPDGQLARPGSSVSCWHVQIVTHTRVPGRG